MHPLVIALVSVLGTLLAVGALVLVLSGGKLGLALQTLGKLRDASFADKVQAILNPPPPEPPKPVKPSGAPLRLLAVLQRDGRLVDFLLEDIQGVADDAQVGAAVRDIHRKCHLALKEHLVLEPVLPQEEGQTVEVPPGFDPSAVRVTGNVPAQPPFRGTLTHRGWRVKEIKLAPPPEGQDEFILQPAEVEVP
jgi:hypothetical protein